MSCSFLGLGVRMHLLLESSMVVRLTQIELHTVRGQLYVLLLYKDIRVAIGVSLSPPLSLLGHRADSIWIGSSPMG